MKRNNEIRFIFKLIILLASFANSPLLGFVSLMLLNGTGLFKDVNSSIGQALMMGFLPTVNIIEAILALFFCPVENSENKIKQKLGRHFNLSVLSGIMTTFNLINFGLWVVMTIGIIKLFDDFG
ncbi:hypothetical protein [uncultured Eubacterium sp.]|uniref:hypothetical protein n=1 Tax=uncultured Eubacterium sp. TaxID=165185 RepID=UPI0015AC9491|nr:hypothetical protein [uncultured Eubacterium sp.]